MKFDLLIKRFVDVWFARFVPPIQRFIDDRLPLCIAAFMVFLLIGSLVFSGVVRLCG